MNLQPTQPARNHPWQPLMLLLVFVLPVVFAVIYFNLATNAFYLLGLTPNAALLVVIGSLVGSMINIPITRRRITLTDPRVAAMPDIMRMFLPIVHYYPPAVAEEVVAINVGGAVVPILFSLYLLFRPTTVILDAVIATVVVVIITKLLARPAPGVGIALPGFVAPIFAAVVAFVTVHFLGGGAATLAAVAYIAGAIGTLIGADLLNLPLVLQGGLLNANLARLWGVGPDGHPQGQQAHILSIGGAGVFDGIFLTAVIAPLLASLTIR